MEEFENWGEVIFSEEETRDILEGFQLSYVWEQNRRQKRGKDGIPFFDRHQSYTYAQAARLLGVSERTVMREAKAERLGVHKIRGCTRIHGTDLLAYQQEGKCK